MQKIPPSLVNYAHLFFEDNDLVLPIHRLVGQSGLCYRVFSVLGKYSVQVSVSPKRHPQRNEEMLALFFDFRPSTVCMITMLQASFLLLQDVASTSIINSSNI